MYRRILGVAIVSILFACPAFTQEPFDREKEETEVTKVIHQSIKWCFPDKSRQRLYGSVVNDSTFFMFQPDSRSTINGFESFREFSERAFMTDACKPKGSEIRGLRIIFSKSGEVAWFSCLLDDWGEYNGEPWMWKDIRWTGVLEKIDGKWVIMQQHLSNAEDAVRAKVEAEIESAGEND